MNTGLKFTSSKTLVKNNTTVVMQEAKVILKDVPGISYVMTMPMFEMVIENIFNSGKVRGSYYDGTVIFKSTGVSKCDPQDKFDNKTGYYIAQSRASQKIIHEYTKLVCYLIHTIDKTFYNDVQNIYTKLFDASLAIDDHINFDLIGED